MRMSGLRAGCECDGFVCQAYVPQEDAHIDRHRACFAGLLAIKDVR